MNKIKLHVENIKALQERVDKINNLNLSDIEFYENGKKVDCEDVIIPFGMLGLNNMDFVNRAFYQGKIEGISIVKSSKNSRS